jgi:hypothetical protein
VVVIASASAWLSAIGTLIAVVIALFAQFWLPYWRRPKLVVEPFDASETSADWTPDNPGGRKGIWFHLRVRNAGRYSPALNAEVILVGAETLELHTADNPNPAGTTPSKSVVPLRPFKWSHVKDSRMGPAQRIEPASADRRASRASKRQSSALQGGGVSGPDRQ